jgi:hypothetical protein
MLKTVDDACDFAAEWCEEEGSHAGRMLSTGISVPDCILRLNARIGHLWESAARVPGPVLRYATPFLGLLGGQDQILDPNRYARDNNGVVPFVQENQGVWSFGFDPESPDQLLVTGDWWYGLERSFEAKWRRVPAKPEDALVCTLLLNLCMQSDHDWDDDDRYKPDAEYSALWRHPAWSNFDGFWINDARTLVRFMGFQASRKPRLFP